MRTFLGFVIAPAVLPSVAFVHVWITRHGDLGKAMFVATALAVIAYRAALLSRRRRGRAVDFVGCR